jgi:hypothetical protein
LLQLLPLSTIAELASLAIEKLNNSNFKGFLKLSPKVIFPEDPP